MYLINTDQGYITAGIPHSGLQFGEKEDAKQFKEVPYTWTQDLITYYCCEEVNLEQIN